MRHAYGSADDIPALLAAAEEPDAARSVWEGLWSRLCHQGTVAGASYAALPALARLAAKREPTGYVEPLHLAASIIASDDGPEDPSGVRRRYAAELASLRAIAERNLALADGPIEFVYGLQALLAFEDVSPWQEHLDSLADDEAEVKCPGCHGQLLVDLTGPEFGIATADGPGAEAGSVVAANPDRLTRGAARAYSLAVEYRQSDVAARMLYLFGRATCPRCGWVFVIPDGFA